MKTFQLDNYGDVVIKNGQIQMVKDMDLIAQTLKQVLNTNLGEWFGDEEEGIDYHVILTKNPNYELIEDTINTAIQQVADGLGIELETDHFTFEVKGRELTISLTIRNSETEQQTEIEVTL